MARHGNSRHLNGMNAPQYYALHRKEQFYVSKPRAGRHTASTSMPLSLLLKKIEVVRTSGEAERILLDGKVMVNGRVVKDPKYAVGLNDLVEIPDAEKSFSVSVDEMAHFAAMEADKDYKHIYKVVGKYKTSGGKVMVRLHDGTSVASDGKVNVNDSVVLGKERKIEKVLHLKEGSSCFVMAGVHVGASGSIKQLKEGSMSRPRSVLVDQGNGSFETIVNNIIIVG
ncbi:MAG: hypothetical protein KGH98_02405 [Candidatus Micrarchaeota archaeon]|nr:hypothetical protein [Candidatus Micrarchaeota archaeon]